MKLLLIEDNVEECEIFDECVLKKSNVEFIGITNSDIESLQYIKKYQPDGIILDLELNKGTGNSTSFGLLETLSKMSFVKRPKIVVTTIVGSETVYNYLHDKGVDLIFYKKNKSYSAENVINTLLLLNEYSTNTSITNVKYSPKDNRSKEEFQKLISDKINFELDLIGIGAHLQGRKYLHDAISYIIQDDGNGDKMTVVQYLSCKYKRSTSTISRAMQNSILHAWRMSSLEDLEKYYTARINYETGIPTPTEFMYFYADKIKREI